MTSTTIRSEKSLREAVLRDLPTLSPMAMKLVGRLSHPNVDYSEVVGIVEKDTLLCAELLRTVNSARYARRGRVDRIGQAMGLLGVSRVRRLALGLTVANLFGRSKMGAHWSQLRFNLHSAGVGVLADILAQKLPVLHADAAFVAGLLHDVGKFAIAANLPGQSEEVLRMARASGRSMVECEREILGFDHAEVSAVMLARWEMPEYVHRAVAAHHAGEFASAIASPGEFANANSLSGAFVETNSCSPISLSRVLHCADRFVNSLGMTTVAGSAELDARAQLEMAGVELDHDEIVAQFAVEYDEFREFLL